MEEAELELKELCDEIESETEFIIPSSVTVIVPVQVQVAATASVI